MDEQLPQSPGNPQTQAQTPPQPSPSQQSQREYYVQPSYGAPPRKGIIESFTQNHKLAALLVIGMLLLMIGLILIHAAPGVTNYGSNPPSYEKQQDDAAFQKSLTIWGHILADIGMIGIAALLLVASIVRKDMQMKIRAGLLILSAFLIVITWIRLLP